MVVSVGFLWMANGHEPDFIFLGEKSGDEIYQFSSGVTTLPFPAPPSSPALRMRRHG